MVIFGYISTLCFAICGVPLAWQCYKEKKCDISIWFLLLWTVGEISAIFYCLFLNPDPLIYIQYIFNFLCLLIVWNYKLKGREVKWLSLISKKKI